MSDQVSNAVHGRGDAWCGPESGVLSFDVLDAWFPPCQGAVKAAASCPDWTLRSSPPCDGAGLIATVASTRGIDVASLSLGAGSSEIIHRVLPRLLGRNVVLTDPTYSEYSFVAEQLHGRSVQRFRLDPREDFATDVVRLAEFCSGASLLVVVNPNNPTGRCLSRDEVLELRARLPAQTVLWVDEAYVEYAPPGTSVEADALSVNGLYVVKSLSKAYALSGARAAYLACAPSEAAELRRSTPPWIVGHAAGLAAIEALRDRPYYDGRYSETAALRSAFARKVRELGLAVWEGSLNAVLIRLPEGRSSSDVSADLAGHGLQVRNPVGMGTVLSDRYVRVAVKPEPQQDRFVSAFASVLEEGSGGHISGLRSP